MSHRLWTCHRIEMESQAVFQAKTFSIELPPCSVGVLAYAAFAASLKFVSATTCSVIGAIEIILAYIFQGGGGYGRR